MQRTPLQSKHYEKLKEYNIGRKDAEHFICFQYQKGETILLEGMPMDYLYLVMKGKAKVCVSTEQGKDLLLSWYAADGIIGDVELMTDSYQATTSITTVTEFECIGIPYQSYAGILKKNAVFLNRAGYELSKKLIRTTLNCKATALYSAETRLCVCLLEASEQERLNVPLTELASAAGTSYRHIQRIMKQLCELHVLKKVKGGYQVINKQYLEDKVPDNYW